MTQAETRWIWCAWCAAGIVGNAVVITARWNSIGIATRQMMIAFALWENGGIAMDKNGQKERVLAYMERYGSITHKQASDDLGVARLAMTRSGARRSSLLRTVRLSFASRENVAIENE